MTEHKAIDCREFVGDGYHHEGGWFFRRMPDGSVQIVIDQRSKAGATTVETRTVHVIGPNEWASIIAHCSASGVDNAETFFRAREFHLGKKV